MSSFITYDTIEQYLNAQWAGACAAASLDVTALVYENFDTDLPDDPAHFVFVEVVGDTFDQESIGAEPRTGNLFREWGQLYLNVMTRNGIGTGLARKYATALVNLFQGLDVGTLTFREASIGAGQPGKNFANYYAMTATVNWRRDQ
jgi:hypothetical protein